MSSPAVRRAVSKQRKKRLVWLHALKNVPCMDCGGIFPPECMDFDHRDKNTKKFQIAQGIHRSMRVLLDEIEKCDLVCANCHRIRTYKK